MNNYGYYQNPYSQVNPMLLNAQNRLQQMEMQYPQLQNNQLQQMQPQTNMLAGRIVENIDSVTVNEIPQDGSSAVFIKSDLSEIYLKSWNKNGLIDTSVYTRQMVDEVKQDDKDNYLENTLTAFQEQLQSIEDKLNKALPSPVNTKPRSVVKEGK